jgi:peptidoglycan/LPS O-acetylase OafA/YrhL
MARPRTEKYDNINLLRACAALAVVVYHVIEHGQWTAIPRHGALGYLHLGWLGVDLFFVISGFVIAYSALILYRRQPGAFANSYWRRRLSRILPLYLLTLVLWIAWTATTFFNHAPGDWAWQVFTHLAFIHNFFPETHGSIDGPNWSLAVEMQFYVAVALLIGWIDRVPGWRIWLYGIVISCAWRAGMVMTYGEAGASILFIRTTQLPGSLDLFGAGIFLAKWVLDGRRRMPMAGLASVLAAAAAGYLTMQLYWPRAVYWDNVYMVVFWRVALSIFFFFVVAAAVELPQALSYRWLSPLDYLGEISYGIYLWHLFAVMLVIRVAGLAGLGALLAVLALTLAAAALSWRYFEKPIMDLARRKTPLPVPSNNLQEET